MISELLEHVEPVTDQEIYSVRLALLTRLKAAVVDLKVASSGSAPIS